MELTQAQQLVIKGHYSVWNLTISRVVKGTQMALDRAKILRENKLYIEYVLVRAQMVEHSMKMLLEGYVCKGRILHSLGENDPYRALNLYKLEKDTLGELVGKARNIGVDPSLVQKLGHLNGLRRELVHHLFDGNRDIEKADKEASSYLMNEGAELLTEMMDAVRKVDREIRELVSSYDGDLLSTPDGT